MRNRLKNKKGFTLAELLIVVAIIGVLVAISIPIFTSQLRKARLATNQANARAAYAAAIAKQLDDASTNGTATGAGSYTYKISDATSVKDNNTAAVKQSAAIASWTVDTLYDDTNKVGDSVAKKWTVVFNNQGEFAGVAGSFAE